MFMEADLTTLTDSNYMQGEAQTTPTSGIEWAREESVTPVWNLCMKGCPWGRRAPSSMGPAGGCAALLTYTKSDDIQWNNHGCQMGFPIWVKPRMQTAQLISWKGSAPSHTGVKHVLGSGSGSNFLFFAPIMLEKWHIHKIEFIVFVHSSKGILN